MPDCCLPQYLDGAVADVSGDPILLRRGRCVGIEGAQAAASPTGKQHGAASVLAFILLQPVCQLQEGAEQGCAIIVGQLDEAGFLDEATQLDQVPRALAPFARPISGVRASACGIEAVTLHH